MAKMVKCIICGAVFEEGADVCPVCGVGPENFVPVEDEKAAFSRDTDEKFVILGGGPAARSAAEAVRERNKTAIITIVSKEKHLPYNRPMLTKALLEDHSDNKLAIEPASWYEENRVFFMGETEAVGINVDDKEVAVVLADGSRGTVTYDKLIYALGAYCFVAPIPGAELEHVLTVRNISDTEAIRKVVAERDVNNVVCIGGGVMGLEGAWTMREAGYNVTVLETAPGLLPRQLDDAASALLEKIAADAGVHIVTGAKIIKITGDAVILEDGTEYPAELVLMSTGMRPYTQLAEDSGIEVDKWVAADEHMRTSAPDVFAAGDCAMVNGQPQVFWAQAEATGKVAGANAAGDDVTYDVIGSALIMHAFGTAVFAQGTNGKDKEYRSEISQDEAAGNYSACYYDGDKLAGAMLVGDISSMSELMNKF